MIFIITYDANSHVVTRTDRNSTLFRRTHDAMGRLVREEAVVNGAVVGSRTYSFHHTGALLRALNGAHSIYYYYDAQGRLIRTHEPSEGIVNHYTYNAANNRLTSRVLVGGNLHINNVYVYSNAQRLIREHDTGAGGETITRAYSFDVRGNHTQMMVTGAQNYTVTSTFDLNNRILTAINFLAIRAVFNPYWCLSQKGMVLVMFKILYKIEDTDEELASFCDPTDLEFVIIGYFAFYVNEHSYGFYSEESIAKGLSWADYITFWLINLITAYLKMNSSGYARINDIDSFCVWIEFKKVNDMAIISEICAEKLTGAYGTVLDAPPDKFEYGNWFNQSVKLKDLRFELEAKTSQFLNELCNINKKILDSYEVSMLVDLFIKLKQS